MAFVFPEDKATFCHLTALPTPGRIDHGSFISSRATTIRQPNSALDNPSEGKLYCTTYGNRAVYLVDGAWVYVERR